MKAIISIVVGLLTIALSVCAIAICTYGFVYLGRWVPIIHWITNMRGEQLATAWGQHTVDHVGFFLSYAYLGVVGIFCGAMAFFALCVVLTLLNALGRTVLGLVQRS